MRYRTLILILVCLAASVAPAAADTTDTEVPDLPLMNDTTDVTDTLSEQLLPADSTGVLDTSGVDVEERLREFRRRRQRQPGLSGMDSLTTYFTSERFNRRRHVDRSFFHDAGDYFRFDPSYLIIEHQVTPLRKTVQPFGLPGDRLNLLIDGHQIHPFEHIPQPDGLTDFNDMPTAFNDDIFVLPGPVGQILGGRSAVATLLTRPGRPSTHKAETALLADKGAFGYSYVRGRYARRFLSGRRINASIGYRDADGPDINRIDDAYHFYGDFYFPLASRAGFRAWGQLYHREGDFVVRPEAGGAAVDRERFDRSVQLSYDLNSSDNRARSEIGYRHLRQGSYVTGVTKNRLNLTGHGVFALREWLSGTTIFQVHLDADYLEYDDGPKNLDRTDGGMTLRVGSLRSGTRWAAFLSARYVEDFRVLPSAAAVLWRETPRSLLMLSVGYSERAPSMYELHLPFQDATLYGSSSDGYAEQGNDNLKSERQLVASAVVELGSVDNNFSVRLTGGTILDGIDWHRETIEDTTKNPIYYTLFSPMNGDIDFFDISAGPSIKLGRWLTFTGGGAWHRQFYGAFEEKAYDPEYQYFSGLELHVFWAQRLLDLFAYGEIVYTGPYHGYQEQEMGMNPVVNAKLSFALKDFRFDFVFQNVLSRTYHSREYVTFPGRYFYYHLQWNFLD